MRRKYRIDRKRVFVAGMSAGGGLAVGARHFPTGADRRRFRPFWSPLRSGIFTADGARACCRTGADTDIARIAAEARAKAHPRVLPVPLMTIQGGRDDVVAPVNAAQLVRQYLALDGHPAAAEGGRTELPPADRTAEATTADGRTVTTREWRVDGRLVARHVGVDQLGHAWSGGDDGLSVQRSRMRPMPPRFSARSSARPCSNIRAST